MTSTDKNNYRWLENNKVSEHNFIVQASGRLTSESDHQSTNHRTDMNSNDGTNPIYRVCRTSDPSGKHVDAGRTNTSRYMLSSRRRHSYTPDLHTAAVTRHVPVTVQSQVEITSAFCWFGRSFFPRPASRVVDLTFRT